MAFVQVWRGRAQPGTETAQAQEGRTRRYWGPGIKVTWTQRGRRGEGIRDGARFPGGNGDISKVGSVAGGARLV